MPIYNPDDAQYQNYQRPFQQAYGYLSSAADNAMPSPESRDRAAGRLRARLSGEYQGGNQDISDRAASMGRSASGWADAQKAKNWGGFQNAYASGLSQLEDDYEKQRQAGAGIMADAGGKMGDIASNNYIGTGKLQNEQQALTTDARRAVWENMLGLGNFLGRYGNVQGDTENPDQALQDNFTNAFQMFLGNLFSNFGM